MVALVQRPAPSFKAETVVGVEMIQSSAFYAKAKSLPVMRWRIAIVSEALAKLIEPA